MKVNLGQPVTSQRERGWMILAFQPAASDPYLPGRAAATCEENLSLLKNLKQMTTNPKAKFRFIFLAWNVEISRRSEDIARKMAQKSTARSEIFSELRP